MHQLEPLPPELLSVLWSHVDLVGELLRKATKAYYVNQFNGMCTVAGTFIIYKLEQKRSGGTLIACQLYALLT